MKALYITFLNEDIRPGYKMKIHSQCKALYELGYESFLYIVTNNGMRLYQVEDISKEIEVYDNPNKRRCVERNIKDEFHLLQFFCKELKSIVEFIRPDVVYIRRIVPANPWIIKGMKYIKKMGARIIYEYPTYPWKPEMIKSKQYFLLMAELPFYKKIEQLSDVIAYMGDYTGNSHKFIQIYNGVDVDSFKPHEKILTEELHLIGVAHVAFYHGYDRVIRGLAEYYKETPDRKIIFHIVGTVDEELGLLKMVTELKLQEYVKFHGFKTGAELDNLFDLCDIGIESLALFRLGNNYKQTASLKSREYMARGIPYLRSAQNVFDDSDLDFIFKVENTDTPVHIKKLLADYNNMKSTKEDIREFARKNLSWKQQMEKVLPR